ncbi:hypothetical protein QE152_g39568 [Popillia japonica]|uniref:Uncharacterized protein n=1 Tax=Popillia japonica TaxID=7064 RepID=A0AAW1HTJ9_POPJA
MTAKAAGIGDQFNSLEESKSYKIGIKNPTGKGKNNFASYQSLTSSFINVLRRFMARREMVANIYSDTGSNFTGELRDPQRLFQSKGETSNIGNFLANKVVANALLTYEEMVNILARPQLHENITQHFWQTSSKENPHQLQYRKKWYKNESRRCYIFLFRYKIL